MTAVERRAARAVAAATARLAERLGEAVPAAEVAHEPGRITLSGAGLGTRRLTDSALRWPAGLGR